MATVAELIREAAQAKGIDVERPEEYRQDGDLHCFRLDVPVGDLTCEVIIMRPDFVRERMTEPTSLFTDDDFKIDERLLGGIVMTLKPEAAVQALYEWQDRFVKVIDEAVERYKAEAMMPKAD